MKLGLRELLFLVLLLAVPSGAYFWIFKPANQRIEQQRQDIEAKVQKLESLRKALGGIEDLGAEVDKLQEAVSFFEAKLPQHHEIHQVLKKVTMIAEKHHLDTKLFKTLKPEVSAGYSEQPIEMSLLGDFDSFYQFLLELEKMQRITKVKIMDLEKSKEKEGMTKSDMELSIYFDNETKSN
jgi:type IV pilus assembly protein PilO